VSVPFGEAVTGMAWYFVTDFFQKVSEGKKEIAG
jgi:hypothetical protein